MRKIIQKSMQEDTVTAISVTIIEKNNLQRCEAVSITTPITDNALFQACSLSQMLTALAIFQLTNDAIKKKTHLLV